MIKKRLSKDPAQTSARAVWQGLYDDHRGNIILLLRQMQNESCAC